MKYLILLALLVAAVAQATDKHIPEHYPATPPVIRHDRDNDALAAVTAGLIAWAIVHHRNKHHEHPRKVGGK